MWIFTGFDSAWGGRQAGAVCHLVLDEDGGLTVDMPSWRAAVRWETARERVIPQVMLRSENHVIAIDQPLVVRNATGSRLVDVALARALMKDYGLGAHAANTSNPCFGPDAGIWRLLRALDAEGYLQDPSAVAEQRPGRYYLECYPNASLVGWLDSRPRYKVRSKDSDAWQRVLSFLGDLQRSELPIVNARNARAEIAVQTKANEDRIDALFSAYTAAYLWRYGFDRNVALGDLDTGYIVMPVNMATRKLLADVAPTLRTPRGGGTSTLPRAPVSETTLRGRHASSPAWERPDSAQLRVAGVSAQLVCADTTNLWGKYNPWMTRFTGADLIVRFKSEDGEPVVRFVPFASRGDAQRGMKVADDIESRTAWAELAAGATSARPLSFEVEYWYEEQP